MISVRPFKLLKTRCKMNSDQLETPENQLLGCLKTRDTILFWGNSFVDVSNSRILWCNKQDKTFRRFCGSQRVTRLYLGLSPFLVVVTRIVNFSTGGKADNPSVPKLHLWIFTDEIQKSTMFERKYLFSSLVFMWLFNFQSCLSTFQRNFWRFFPDLIRVVGV